MSNDTVNWQQIPGCAEGFEASSDGRIAHVSGNRRRLCQPNALRSGHLVVNVKDATGKPQRAYVHRLVLTAFKGQPEPGMYGCHYDDDPTNNQLDNLRWDTPKGNGEDHHRNHRANKRLTAIAVHASWTPEKQTLGDRYNELVNTANALATQRTHIIHELDRIREQLP